MLVQEGLLTQEEYEDRVRQMEIGKGEPGKASAALDLPKGLELSDETLTQIRKLYRLVKEEILSIKEYERKIKDLDEVKAFILRRVTLVRDCKQALNTYKKQVQQIIDLGKKLNK